MYIYFSYNVNKHKITLNKWGIYVRDDLKKSSILAKSY